MQLREADGELWPLCMGTGPRPYWSAAPAVGRKHWDSGQHLSIREPAEMSGYCFTSGPPVSRWFLFWEILTQNPGKGVLGNEDPKITTEQPGPGFKASVLLTAPGLLSTRQAISVGILFLAPSVSLTSIPGWSRASVRHCHAIGNSRSMLVYRLLPLQTERREWLPQFFPVPVHTQQMLRKPSLKEALERPARSASLNAQAK